MQVRLQMPAYKGWSVVVDSSFARTYITLHVLYPQITQIFQNDLRNLWMKGAGYCICPPPPPPVQEIGTRILYERICPSALCTVTVPCPAVISAMLVGAFDGDTGVALVHVKKYGERPPVALAVT